MKRAAPTFKPGTNVWVDMGGGNSSRAVVVEYRGYFADKHIYRVRDLYSETYEASENQLAFDTDPACEMCRNTGMPMITLASAKHNLSLTVCQNCIDYADTIARP